MFIVLQQGAWSTYLNCLRLLLWAYGSRCRWGIRSPTWDPILPGWTRNNCLVREVVCKEEVHFLTLLWKEMLKIIWISLRWRHNGRDSVSNHQPHDCLLNRLFRRRSKKTSKLRVTGLCAGNSPGTDEFPAQMASNAENVSIWWRHHVMIVYHKVCPHIIMISGSYRGSTCLDVMTSWCYKACGIYFWHFVITFWSDDALWRHRIGSALAQIMAYCLTALSHYLTQRVVIVSGV